MELLITQNLILINYLVSSKFMTRRHILAIILTFIICSYTFGHSGGTDKNGGHYNRKTGEYHYHNGGGSGLFWVV
jgi:hypothetical protein